MDDPRALHRRAGAMTGTLVDRITPGQLSLPTPCTELDVQTLINHLVYGNLRFAARLDGSPGPDQDAFVLGDDPAADYRASTDRLCAAFEADDFLDRLVWTPLGDQPGRALVGIRIMELTLHGWDLAVATGQPRDLDPELVAFATTALRSMSFPRGSGAPFWPEQPAPAGASAADKLAALSGRMVPTDA